MKRFLFPLFFLLTILTACRPAPSGQLATATHADRTEISTEIPSSTPEPALQQDLPTPTALPITDTPTLERTVIPPTETPAQAIMENTPTATAPAPTEPTITQTLEPQAAVINIIEPANQAKLISPIQMQAILPPGERGHLTIELLGRDGRVITRQIMQLNSNPNNYISMDIDLPFEIPKETETGRLIIYRQDNAGRTTSLSSLELILLSAGQNDYNGSNHHSPAIVLQSPQYGSVVKGGTLLISGLARPSLNLNLVAELITDRGWVVGHRVFKINDEGQTDLQPFDVEIPFSIAEPTWVLLIVRERSESFPGTTYLTSTEVFITP